MGVSHVVAATVAVRRRRKTMSWKNVMWISKLAWGEERGAAAKARRRRRRGRRSRGRQELENKEEKLKREETRRSRNRRKELQSKTHHPQQQHSKETTQHRGEGGMEPRTPSQHTVDRGVRRV